MLIYLSFSICSMMTLKLMMAAHFFRALFLVVSCNGTEKMPDIRTDNVTLSFSMQLSCMLIGIDNNHTDKYTTHISEMIIIIIINFCVNDVEAMQMWIYFLSLSISLVFLRVCLRFLLEQMTKTIEHKQRPNQMLFSHKCLISRHFFVFLFFSIVLRLTIRNLFSCCCLL